MRFGSSGRYDANGLTRHDVRNKEQMVVHHANDDVAVFAIVFTVIQPFDGERVLNKSLAISKVRHDRLRSGPP
jgi:hypothetical protein